PGDQLGIGGTQVAPRRLFYAFAGAAHAVLAGKTEITPRTWHHLALVRDGRQATIYLDGSIEPEIVGQAPVDAAKGPVSLFVGGRGDAATDFEGKVDAV